MTDIVSKEKRSVIMSKIRAKNTRLELRVRKWLFGKGIRYRKYNRKIKGSPEISIKKYKIAIFINGCFWHGHEGCMHFRLPKSNIEFWESKIIRNVERDKATTEYLRGNKWTVIVLWECELNDDFESIMAECYGKIQSTIHAFRDTR